MDTTLSIIVVTAVGTVGFFIIVPRLMRLLFETEDERSKRIIEERKAQAKKRGITPRAILVAKQLGTINRYKEYVYEDTMLKMLVGSSSVEVKLKEKDTLVFKADYSDKQKYEYTTGTSLERRDDGGYDVVHETATGGGFSQTILGYIPGEWEQHIQDLERVAIEKRTSEHLEHERREKEQAKKSFGL
jgi:hypothetical protein